MVSGDDGILLLDSSTVTGAISSHITALGRVRQLYGSQALKCHTMAQSTAADIQWHQ